MWEEQKLQINLEGSEVTEWREDVAEFVAQPLSLILQAGKLGENPRTFAQHLAQVFYLFPRKQPVDPLWVAYMRWRLELIVPISSIEFREDGDTVYHRRVFYLDQKRVMYAGGGEMKVDTEMLSQMELSVEPFRKLMEKRLIKSVGGSRDAYWLKLGEAFFMSIFHFDSMQEDHGAITSYFINYLEWRLGGRRYMRLVN